MKCIELREKVDNDLYGIFILDDSVIKEEAFKTEIDKIIFKFNETNFDWFITDVLLMLPNEWHNSWKYYDRYNNEIDVLKI